MSKVSIPDRFSITVTGLEEDELALAKTALAICGRRIQQQLSDAFETERSGAGALRANTAAYQSRKVLRGFDPRRGHRTGALQGALRSVRMWRVTGSKDHARLFFSSSPIKSAIPYAKFYEATKVKGANLAIMQKAWLRDCAKEVRSILRGRGLTVGAEVTTTDARTEIRVVPRAA